MAIFLSFLLTQYVVEDMMKKDAIDDFVSDTTHIFNKINRQITEENLPAARHELVNQVLPEDFSIRWLPIQSGDKPCQQCKFLTNVGDVKVFELSTEEQLLAVYRLESFNMRLIIADKDHSASDDIEEQGEDLEFFVGLNAEEAVFALFVFVLLLIIALTIYWPIRQLQKQINSLVLATKHFGAGNLNVRTEQQLTKPLNNLANSFNAMASSITDTVKENQIFAQAIPHEVRTPLSRIQLATGLLRKSEDKKQQQVLLDNIDTYIDDIDDLIAQVVAFSKLNVASDYDESSFYQTIELNAFVLSRIEALTREKQITVELDIEPSAEITTNPIYLRLLIDNLIKNALSHGKYLVKVSVQEKQNYTLLTVEDDGPGIAEEFHDTIFFPFARLDKSRSRKTGGLGLGLAIAKSATKRMFGELSVEKKGATGGAVFVVKFLY